MTHRYQGNQSGWSGHRGGHVRGQSHRGRGGWQQQGTSGECRENSSQGWNQQNSPVPLTSNQWGKGNWQQQGTNGTSSWPNQLFVQNQFENQQNQVATSQQMPPYNQNSALPPMHPRHPGANIYTSAPPVHQEQGQPRSFVPPNALQPQFAPQQHLQPNRTQHFPVETSRNPLMQTVRHPPPSAGPELPPQNSAHDAHMPLQLQQLPSASYRDSHLPSSQHAAPDQSLSEVKTQRMLDEEWVSQFVSRIRQKQDLPLCDGKGTVMSVSMAECGGFHYDRLLNVSLIFPLLPVNL